MTDHKLPGNHQQRDVAPGITLNCMAPNARSLMDEALEKYQEHIDEIRKWKPGHQESVYSFAYWLFRWSGLVTPEGKLKSQNENSVK